MIWSHPWLTLSVALRTLLETDRGERWGDVRPLISKVLALRSRVRAAGWFK